MDRKEKNYKINPEKIKTEVVNNVPDWVEVFEPTIGSNFAHSFIEAIPDTLDRNINYNFEYKLPKEIDLSSLNKDFYLFFYLTSEKGTFQSVKEIESVKHDIFVFDSLGKMNIEIKLTEIGHINITGIIEHQEFIPGKTVNDSITIRTHESTFSKKLFVKDNSIVKPVANKV